MLKQKRAAKCPFLTKFISLAVEKGKEEHFVATENVFEEYCAAVAVWTEGDSLHGQTKYLMRRTAFHKASFNVYLLRVTTV